MNTRYLKSSICPGLAKTIMVPSSGFMLLFMMDDMVDHNLYCPGYFVDESTDTMNDLYRGVDKEAIASTRLSAFPMMQWLMKCLRARSSLERGR